jgi:phosphonopyruvate decarboxylase
LDASEFVEMLQSNTIDSFFGVPDSLLKNFAMYVSDKYSDEDTHKHIISANEATAVGLAAGHYMATGNPACVYLQNSGLGNIVNPVMSLSHERVYGIPTLFLIGWRGDPGAKKDEPQHNFMGEQSQAVLDSMKMRHSVLPNTPDEARAAIAEAVAYMKEHDAPYAFMVRKETFTGYKLEANLVPAGATISREEAIQSAADALGEDVAIVSATGMPSRELYEHRVARFGVDGATGRDFLTVGSMGCCSSIALGLALGAPGKQIVCLDGDGGTIMHMGAMITNGQKAPANFKHLVVNNGAHDSVGGQPTYAFEFELTKMAEASGYKAVRIASTLDEVTEGCKWLKAVEGPALLEVRVKLGARKDLGRPKSTPAQNKAKFMEHVASL